MNLTRQLPPTPVLVFVQTSGPQVWTAREGNSGYISAA